MLRISAAMHQHINVTPNQNSGTYGNALATHYLIRRQAECLVEPRWKLPHGFRLG